MFPIAQKYVSQSVLVSDEEITRAQQLLWSALRIVAEPGGAAAFAALVSRRYLPSRGERVGVLICGANTSAVNFGSPTQSRSVSQQSANATA
jgi:threonine dehydratase